MSPKVIGIILVVILAISGLYLAEQYWLKPSTQTSGGPGLMTQLPDAIVYDSDGNEVPLSEFRGQPLVINFWATWCLPCIIEMPFVNQVYNEFRDQGVVIIGISEDVGGWSDIESFLVRLEEEKGTVIDYPMYLDIDQQVADAFGGIFGLPNTFIVDSEGRITKKHIGYMDIDSLRNAIRDVLPRQADADNKEANDAEDEKAAEDEATE